MAQLVALLLALFNILSVYLSHEESKVVVNTRQLQEKKVWNRDRSGGHSRRGASTAVASHRYPAHSNGLVTSGQVNHRPREMRKDSYVIATLVTETNAKYRNALRIFILSLRRIAKYKGTIVIVIAKNLELKIEEEYMKNVLIQPVDVLEVAIGGHLGPNRHYSKLLTKLQLWNLHYEHVVYYDSDVIFLKNPVPGIKRECPKDKKICAVLDEGAKLYFNKDNYMNAGFLVIRPNKEDYQYLMKNRQHAERTAFVEQDMLNLLFKNDWVSLSPAYNHMHVSATNGITEETVAVHEKYWIINRMYPNLLGTLPTLESVL